MGKTPVLCVVVVLVVLSACGKSQRSDGGRGPDGGAGETSGGTDAETGGSSSGGSGGAETGGKPSGGSGTTSGSGGAASTECVVVRRVACCPQPFAVTREEFEADECLLPFDQNLTEGSLLGRCEEKRPADCGPENCARLPPPSRVAVRDAAGVCQFVDECTSDDDCTFAAQCCSCCACAEPTPKSRARREACIVSDDPAVEPEPRECLVCPGGNLCQGCFHERTSSCSVTPKGFRRCEWGPELAMDKCTAERACASPFPSETCYAPDFNCGGPVPPPDECAVDADCADAGVDLICSPVGYCGRKECVPGCASDADCTLAEVCSPTHHCEPKPCSDRAACGPNFECSPDGFCVRADCASTAACEGYCVNGFCYDEPGFCSELPI